MLELKNLRKTYRLKKSEVHAVKDINLTFQRGEFVSILGLSGSGKTTLVSLIGGLEEPSSGQMFIDGINTSTFNKKKWTDYRKNTIGFVFQDFNLIQHLSAIENIKISLSLSGMAEKEKEIRATELLELVGMSDQGSQFPKELSGGQQQRIAIARALANDPEIILADEPSGALDPDTAQQIMNLLKSLAEKDHLVIMVTHDKYLAKAYSTRIIELKDGEIINEIGHITTHIDNHPPVEMKKSHLEFKSALKIAWNNLKIRKRSSIIALISLIPSIILVTVLGNLLINLMTLEADLDPLYNSIVNEDHIYYISNKTEASFDTEVKGTIVGIQGGRIDGSKINKLQSELFQPYSEVALEKIRAIDNVEAVFVPHYYDVNIGDNHFILVGLLPEKYKQYQYDFPFEYYPKDDDAGLILSVEASEIIFGKDITNVEMENIEFKVTSFNGLPLHPDVYTENRNDFKTTVLQVFNPKNKTVLMKDYYKGYIYASSGYVNQVHSMFTAEDISLIAFHVPDALSPEAAEGKLIVDGSKNLSDLLLPLRNQPNSNKTQEIFKFKMYPPEIPSSNYLMRHMIITKEALSQQDELELLEFGALYRTKFDEYAYESAIQTKINLNKVLLYTKCAIGVIVVLPSVLVALILYISIILRTKEIGILKSIGAKSHDIVTIFTMESGLLAITAGIIASVLTLPLIRWIQIFVEKEYQLTEYLGSNPLDANILAILGSLITIITLTTLLGLLPGQKASRLHPRVLLRRIN